MIIIYKSFLRKLFELCSTDIGASRPNSTKNIKNRCIQISTVRQFNSFSLRCTVVCDATRVFLKFKNKFNEIW